MSDTTLTFDPTGVGDSDTQVLLVYNVGPSDLTVDSVAISSGHTTDFSITDDNCSGTTLPQNAFCDIEVEFSPTVGGARSAVLTIVSDDPNENPLQIQLNGEGLGPDISAPAFVTFPITAVGDSSTHTVQVFNVGGAPLNVLTVELGGANSGDFAIADDNCSGVTLGPGGSCDVEVEFSPTAGGVRVGTLTVYSTDPDEPAVTVVLTGPAADAELLVPSPFSFGLVDLGGSVTRDLPVVNLGSTPLTILAITLTAGDTGDFSIDGEDCTPTLLPGDVCTVTITFAPLVAGARTATLAIVSDGPVGLATATLIGQGAPSGPPDIPTLVAIWPCSATTACISWDPVEGATFYRLRTALNFEFTFGVNTTDLTPSGPGNLIVVGVPSTDMGVFYYSLAACNPSGCSDFAFAGVAARREWPGPGHWSFFTTAYQFLGTVFAAAVHVNPPTKVSEFNFYEGIAGFGPATLVASCGGVPGGGSCSRGWFATLNQYITVGQAFPPFGEVHIAFRIR